LIATSVILSLAECRSPPSASLASGHDSTVLVDDSHVGA